MVVGCDPHGASEATIADKIAITEIAQHLARPADMMC
jgi:hypothetical protein